ncbi:MAG: F0F1 ATP synthase subunit delta [Verrucomicrobiae bacterium]|nr:F0F1 ATP synthase subunit delta [Verrucomicrobiae bacterium]NNJ43659.1 H(+)-transporting ATPase [Akkermansiaceae bacterium]
MKVSKDAASAARRIYRLCSADGRLDQDKVRTAFRKVAAAKPRDYRAILHALLRLVRLDEESRQAVIESAVDLDSPSRVRIEQSLNNQYGGGLSFSYSTDPELLGGVKIRVGNDVWDGSVQSRLERLTSAF